MSHFESMTDEQLKDEFQNFTRALRNPNQGDFTREEERSQALLMKAIVVRGLDFLAWEREVVESK